MRVCFVELDMYNSNKVTPIEKKISYAMMLLVEHERILINRTGHKDKTLNAIIIRQQPIVIC